MKGEGKENERDLRTGDCDFNDFRGDDLFEKFDQPVSLAFFPMLPSDINVPEIDPEFLRSLGEGLDCGVSIGVS